MKLMKLTRAEAAYAQDIRGNAPKALGRVLSTAFCSREPLDLSSGDTPKCLGPGGFASIDTAMAGVSPDHMAYDHPLYGEAQDASWSYLTGLDGKGARRERDRTQIISGVSTFMQQALEVAAHALGYPQESRERSSPLIVFAAPTHPHWLAMIVQLFGSDAFRVIRRGSDGLPDMEHAEEVFRGLDRPFILLLSPDENPTGVCTPNRLLINSEQTGIINRVVNHSRWGVVLLDAIYMDAAWGPEAGKRHELISQAVALGARMMVMHSLSKIFRKPGIRIGAASYAGPLSGETEEIGLDLLSRLKAIAQGNIMNGISSVALAGLIEAYSGKPEIKREIGDTIGLIRGRVESNAATLNRGFIEPAYPQTRLEAAFYGLHRIRTSGNTPWNDPEYHQHLIRAIEGRLDLGDLGTQMMWRNLRQQFGIFGMSASHAFAIETAMNGLQILPFDPFYPMFAGNDFGYRVLPDVVWDRYSKEDIVFRTILAYPEKTTREARTVLERVWEDGNRAYKDSAWRSRYGSGSG